jgi:hypothetical protein
VGAGKLRPSRRFQTFLAQHVKPVTDALIGQGMMSLGGIRLPYPREVL